MGSEPSSSTGALEGVRVVDATCGRGERAGRLLADLGAEVIQIEPPGGVPARRLPPFEIGEDGEPGGSLYWAAHGLGKRSVVLDVFDASENGGADRLRAFLRSADVFIESFDPGALAAVGLDPATACTPPFRLSAHTMTIEWSVRSQPTKCS